MTLFHLFKRNSSAEVAKNRLMMTLAYERASTKIENLNQLKEELIGVVKKYVKVKDIIIKTDQNQQLETLEVEIILES
ncbi:MAG: cell division topological specificity factor MinE [Campylobacterales bacterium]